jgi:Mg2+ and Co2+ transporter CorA
MQQPKEDINQPSYIFTTTCAVLLVLITLFGLYGMKQIKKYDTDKIKTTIK